MTTAPRGVSNLTVHEVHRERVAEDEGVVSMSAAHPLVSSTARLSRRKRLFAVAKPGCSI